MRPTDRKALMVFDEAVETINKAIAEQKRQEADDEPFDGRVARESAPLLQAIRTMLDGCAPRDMGMEIIRVSQSLRRFQEGTYTSFLSFPKYIREKYYLTGLAAMLIVRGENVGRGLPDPMS